MVWMSGFKIGANFEVLPRNMVAQGELAVNS